MASYSKVVTGLTGLNVAKNPTHTLGVLYRYDTDDDDADDDEEIMMMMILMRSP